MWKPVYSHNTLGDATGGSKESLLKLVREGQPVRVVFDIEDTRVTSLGCDALFIRNGEVYAQTSFIISEWSDPDKQIMRFSNPSSAMTFNLSTTGKSHVRSQHASDTYDDREYRHAITWFVED